MKSNASRVGLGLLSLVFCLYAFGCAGEQTPVDSGMDGDGDIDHPDSLKLCNSNEDCPSGLTCREGICAAGTSCDCNSQCIKANTEKCNRATHQCVTGVPSANCIDDCDCYSGESCVQAMCVPTGGDVDRCQDNADCAQGEVCTDGKCLPGSCAKREDCAGPVCLVCKGGTCKSPPSVCQGVADCCVGFKCNFGTCVPVPTGECQSDSDCKNPDYPRCDANKLCVQECLNNIDCPEGQVCLENHCKDVGCTPQSCSGGQWCDPGDGQCKAGCDAHEDCLPPAACNFTTHQCGASDCCGGCQAGEYCDTLTCQCTLLCQDATDCPATFVCRQDGTCVCTATTLCPQGTTCNTSSGTCEQQQTSCQSNADCPTGWTCNLLTNLCEAPSGGGQEGDLCFKDTQCDASQGLLCDSCIFCLVFGCLFEPVLCNEVPTYACRSECSSATPVCSITGQVCMYRHSGLKYLCVPPAAP